MRLEDWSFHLRDEHRLKKGTDYNYTFKYGKLYVLTCEVWVDILKEHLEEYEITVEEWFTYK